MNIAHSETTPWGPVRGVRGGTIQFKEMLVGDEGKPTNFSLVIANTDLSFKSPRHRHNFDQIRITLDGSTNFGPRQNIEVGDVAYFPEGTYYGPQNQELVRASSVAMVIQFGGASGQGYMSQRQLFEGQEKLQAVGRFEGGIFRREAPGPNEPHNQDAYEAIWEHQNGRPIHYPKPRMTEPVHFRGANIPWQPVPEQAGAWLREFGRFTERGIHILGLRIEAGASYQLPAGGQERVLFVIEGAGRFDSGEPWARHSAAHLQAQEAPVMRASEDTELLVLGLPRFREGEST